MLSLEKKPKPNEVSSNYNIPSNMVLSPVGMIWKESGIIAFTMNSELLQKNTLVYLLKPQ
jgi:hypothetical protein